MIVNNVFLSWLWPLFTSCIHKPFFSRFISSKKDAYEIIRYILINKFNDFLFIANTNPIRLFLK
ncbi:hypothetical protein CW304_21995 [Bacillus sp. UFRGS-B20]|nr:hypothetical protein CW304_21995 [Bacillus sp. UFRGS-B20]